MEKQPNRHIGKLLIAAALSIVFAMPAWADKQARREAEIEQTQKEFQWWPTDARPAPVKDKERGGYWWWPTQPGEAGPLWGNRGYCYVAKVIYDYKSEELPPAQPKELRPSLVIKKILKNVKVYFDYNASAVREDASTILREAAKTLKRNPETDILVTGNCDTRGSEAYNEKLGRKRADAVRQFLLDEGIEPKRIRIVSRGKLDAVAPVTDLVGMQKDRNAQFMIAEVEEVMIPAPPASAQGTTAAPEGQIVTEEKKIVESEVRVTTKEYVIQKNDSLWKIAQKELGSGHRWKYLYELNKNRIKNPNKLRAGQKIIIPIE